MSDHKVDEAPAGEQVVRPTSEQTDQALDLLASMVDGDPCWFDHNGDCQAHGWFDLRGAGCPHAEAKQLLDDLGVDWR